MWENMSIKWQWQITTHLINMSSYDLKKLVNCKFGKNQDTQSFKAPLYKILIKKDEELFYSGRHHLNKGIKWTSSVSMCQPIGYNEKSKVCTSVIILPKLNNLNFLVRKHRTNPNWEPSYKITDLKSSKWLWTWKPRTHQGAISDWKTGIVTW